MKSASSFLLLSLAAASVVAQTLPDSGQILQQVTPGPQPLAPAIPRTNVEESPSTQLVGGQRIRIQRFRVRGATMFSEAELVSLIDHASDNNELTLAELGALAERITRYYRARGYLVARAYVPPQEVLEGTITIAVSEGRIGEVRLDNRAGIADSALAPLEAVASGDVVRTQVLESSLLALSDLPGVEVKSTLRPGATVGTSDLLVEVKPGTAIAGSADVDTFGNRYTGASRLGASLFWNNPAGRGDQASLRLQTSESGFHYGRASYQLPFGKYAARIGVAGSNMRYQLGKEFASLRAGGEATIASLYFQLPFIRSQDVNLLGQLQYDDKQLVDRIGATSTEIGKDIANWTVGIEGSLADGIGEGGINTARLAYGVGSLHLDATSAAIDRITSRTQGRFGKWTVSLRRMQRLPANMHLTISYSGQWASKNLDSSEKFMLGGAYGVRAYPQGEATGDEGQLVSLELGSPLVGNWEIQGFLDDGRVTAERNPWITSTNKRHLAGYGIGVAYSNRMFHLRAFAAWKAGTGSPTSDSDRTPRIWMQGAAYF